MAAVDHADQWQLGG